MTPKPIVLNDLIAHAEGYANFALRKFGRMSPVLFAATPSGELWFVPDNLADVRAKNDFANTARLICVAYEAQAVVMALEAWVTIAKPGEPLDNDTPPSEAYNRQEFVVLMGEAAGHQHQKLLPIIRTGVGGFFGFGEFDSQAFDGFKGRFAGLLPPKAPGPDQRKLAKAMLAVMGVTEASLRGRFSGN
jgi:hypothetical protein